MTTPEVEVQRAICYAIGTLEHLSTMALTQPDPHERDMQIELTANAIERLWIATSKPRTPRKPRPPCPPNSGGIAYQARKG